MTQIFNLILFVSLAFAFVISVWAVARHLSTSRQAKAQLTTGQDYRALPTSSGGSATWRSPRRNTLTSGSPTSACRLTR